MRTNMIITVSGYPNSGTTSVSQRLADQLTEDVEYINGGDVFRGLAERREMSLSEFSKYVNDNPMIDEDIDATLRAAIECFTTSANRDRVDLPISIDYSAHILIVESRLAGWIAGCDATISVWCEASETVRKNRAEDSERSESAEELLERQQDEAMRYEKTYGIDIHDMSPYDLTVNTAVWSPDAIGKSIKQLVESHTEENVEPDISSGSAETFSHIAEQNIYE